MSAPQINECTYSCSDSKLTDKTKGMAHFVAQGLQHVVVRVAEDKPRSEGLAPFRTETEYIHGPLCESEFHVEHIFLSAGTSGFAIF